MCAVGDVKTMAEKGIYILSDDERLKQFKANAKARAAEFDIHEIVPKYEKFYEQIIEKSQRAGQQ
jgi:glycosyltransferase involved in cell wall biosynthesis